MRKCVVVFPKKFARIDENLSKLPRLVRRILEQLTQYKTMESLTTTPSVSSTRKVNPIPEGMHTVTPHLACAGAADAIEFYKKAFGAEEICRVAGPDGKLMHGAIRIGDSMVFLGDEFPNCGCLGPKARGGSSVTIHLQVEDVDAAFKRALDAGATVRMPLDDMFWGDRYGIVEDPFGHSWSLATHIREVGPEELQKAAQQGCG
jgi:PhnB protein